MNMTAVYSFIGGVVIGGLAALFVADKMLRADYDAKYDEERAAMKRYYETKADISKVNSENEAKKDEKQVNDAPFMEVVSIKQPKNRENAPKTQYSSYASRPLDENSEEYKNLMKEIDGYSSESFKETQKPVDCGPFVISETDFKEGNYPVGYGEDQLTYYDEENTMFNADGDQIYDWFDMIGHCLDDFCEPDEDGSLPREMFVQNDRERMMYILSRE